MVINLSPLLIFNLLAFSRIGLTWQRTYVKMGDAFDSTGRQKADKIGSLLFSIRFYLLFIKKN